MKYHTLIVEEILKNIRLGLNGEDSAILAGVSRGTFYDWKAKKPDFLDALLRAELDRKKRDLTIIHLAGKKSWQASAWRLERLYPKEFAIKHLLQHSGPGGGAIPISGTTVNMDLGKIDIKKVEEMFSKLDAFLRPTPTKNQD